MREVSENEFQFFRHVSSVHHLSQTAYSADGVLGLIVNYSSLSCSEIHFPQSCPSAPAPPSRTLLSSK